MSERKCMLLVFRFRDPIQTVISSFPQQELSSRGDLRRSLSPNRGRDLSRDRNSLEGRSSSPGPSRSSRGGPHPSRGLRLGRSQSNPGPRITKGTSPRTTRGTSPNSSPDSRHPSRGRSLSPGSPRPGQGSPRPSPDHKLSQDLSPTSSVR